jgi:hypothetical protein
MTDESFIMELTGAAEVMNEKKHELSFYTSMDVSKYKTSEEIEGFLNAFFSEAIKYLPSRRDRNTFYNYSTINYFITKLFKNYFGASIKFVMVPKGSRFAYSFDEKRKHYICRHSWDNVNKSREYTTYGLDDNIGNFDSSTLEFYKADGVANQILGVQADGMKEAYRQASMRLRSVFMIREIDDTNRQKIEALMRHWLKGFRKLSSDYKHSDYAFRPGGVPESSLSELCAKKLFKYTLLISISDGEGIGIPHGKVDLAVGGDISLFPSAWACLDKEFNLDMVKESMQRWRECEKLVKMSKGMDAVI